MSKLMKLGLAGTAMAVILAGGGLGLKSIAEAQGTFKNTDQIRLAEAYGGERGSQGGHRGKRWGHRGGRHGRGGRRKMRRMRSMMEQYDTNNDEKLSFTEIEDGRKQQVQKFDRDSNGGLSLQEFAPLWAEMRRQRIIRTFQRLDRDGDGTVTESEFVDPAVRMARRMDRNGDGAVSREDRRKRRGFWRRRGGDERREMKRDETPKQQ